MAYCSWLPTADTPHEFQTSACCLCLAALALVAIVLVFVFATAFAIATEPVLALVAVACFPLRLGGHWGSSSGP